MRRWETKTSVGIDESSMVKIDKNRYLNIYDFLVGLLRMIINIVKRFRRKAESPLSFQT